MYIFDLPPSLLGHQELYQFLSRPLPKLLTASSKKEREEWLRTLRQLYCSQLNANSQLSTKCECSLSFTRLT